jgi:type II secretory pathway pseudopilin PulG
MKRAQCRRGGYLMIEMLLLLLILSVFALISARLFTSVMKLNYNASQAHTRTVRFDSAMRMLRADAWTASEMSAANQVVTLKMAEGGAVDWSVDKDGTIVRTSRAGGKEDVLRWSADVGGISLAVEGPRVVVRIPDSSRTSGTELGLINQRRLAEGMAL